MVRQDVWMIAGVGAPNLIRGGSHSGNVAASHLADLNLLDILSSDYVPSALLNGALMLGDQWGDIARGIATVTRAPALATERRRGAPPRPTANGTAHDQMVRTPSVVSAVAVRCEGAAELRGRERGDL